MTPPQIENWLAALLIAAATWRLTHLLMYEAGPWNVVVRLRRAFGVRHDRDTHEPIAYPDGSAFECFLCFSVWVSPLMIALWAWAWIVVAVLAGSAAAIWVERWYGGRRGKG